MKSQLPHFFFSPSLLTCEQSNVLKSVLTGQEFTESHFFNGMDIRHRRSHSEKGCGNWLDHAAGHVLNTSTVTLRIQFSESKCRAFPLGVRRQVTLKSGLQLTLLLSILITGAVGYTCGIYLLHKNHNIPTICHQIC